MLTITARVTSLARQTSQRFENALSRAIHECYSDGLNSSHETNSNEEFSYTNSDVEKLAVPRISAKGKGRLEATSHPKSGVNVTKLKAVPRQKAAPKTSNQPIAPESEGKGKAPVAVSSEKELASSMTLSPRTADEIAGKPDVDNIDDLDNDDVNDSTDLGRRAKQLMTEVLY